MPQENQVVRCCSCKMFQVHIVKKARKWECKICNTKQSLMMVYGRGSGKECRNHVMKLKELQYARNEDGDSMGCGENIVCEEMASHVEVAREKNENSVRKSKWSAYAEEERGVEVEDDEGEEEFYKACMEKNFNRKRKGRRAGNAFDPKPKLQKCNNAPCISDGDHRELLDKFEKPKFGKNSFFSNNPPGSKETSKWAAYADDDDVKPREPDNNDDDDDELLNNKSVKFEKRIKSINVNRKSKWAGYVDDDDDGEQTSKPLEDHRSRETFHRRESEEEEVDGAETDGPRRVVLQSTGKSNIFEAEVNDQDLDDILRL